MDLIISCPRCQQIISVIGVCSLCNWSIQRSNYILGKLDSYHRSIKLIEFAPKILADDRKLILLEIKSIYENPLCPVSS